MLKKLNIIRLQRVQDNSPSELRLGVDLDALILKNDLCQVSNDVEETSVSMCLL